MTEPAPQKLTDSQIIRNMTIEQVRGILDSAGIVYEDYPLEMCVGHISFPYKVEDGAEIYAMLEFDIADGGDHKLQSGPLGPGQDFASWFVAVSKGDLSVLPALAPSKKG